MSTDLNFKVQKIQFALFPKDFDLVSNPSEIAHNLKQKINYLLDGEETISSLIGAPSEIPRIILQSKNRVFRCEIAISRIDFFQELGEISESNFIEIRDDYLLKTKQIYSYFINDMDLSIGRIGFVIDFFTDLPINESSNKLLQNKLFKRDSFLAKMEKLKNILLVFTEETKINSLDINKLIKIETLRKKDNPENNRRLSLRYDVNTILEKKQEYNLTVTEIENFLKGVSEEEDISVLNKIFN